MAEEIILKITADTSGAGKNVKAFEKDVDNLAQSVDEAKQSVKDFQNEPWKDPKIEPFLTKLNELNKRVEDGQMTMRQYNQTIKQYQTIALQAGETSPIGIEAINRASQLTDRIGDLRNATKNLADDHKKLSGVIGISQGVIAGYGAWQGAMALVGEENEDLQKTMTKLMAVQATLNGVMEIRQMLEKESSAMLLLQTARTKLATTAQIAYTFATTATTTAMKLLRVAMLAIPIVAIIAGIVAIVYAIDQLTTSTVDLEQANNDLNDSFDRMRTAMDRANKSALQAIDNQIELAKATGASIEEISRLESKRLDQEEKNRKKSLKLTAQEISEKKKLLIEAVKQGEDDRAKEILKEIEDSANKFKDLKALDGQYAHDKKILEIETNNEIAERNKQANDNAKQIAQQANAEQKRLAQERKAEEEKMAQEKIERERLLQDLINENIADSDLRRMAILKTQHQRELDELTTKYGIESDIVVQAKLKQKNEEDALNEQIRIERQTLSEQELANQEALREKERQSNIAYKQGELIQMRMDFEATQELKEELALLERDAELANKNLTEGEKFRIEQEYQQKLIALDEERAERQKQINQEMRDATLNSVSAGLNAISSLSDAIFTAKLAKAEKGSAQELAIQKKQFEQNKKMQIAIATINGIQGVINALTAQSVIPEPIGSILKAANAVAVGITTAANIAKIKSTTFGGGASATISTPSVTAPSIPSIENIQPQETATAGLPQGGQAPTQPTVVIVDSDIKASQDNLNQVEVISKVG